MCSLVLLFNGSAHGLAVYLARGLAEENLRVEHPVFTISDLVVYVLKISGITDEALPLLALTEYPQPSLAAYFAQTSLRPISP